MTKAKEMPTIIIDTREPPDCAWRFDAFTVGQVVHPALPVVRAKLDQADYSVLGIEHACGLERKTVDDFLSSLTHGRERFEAEMERLASYPRALIAVEGHLDDVIDGTRRPGVRPVSVVGSVSAIHARWGVSTVFLGSRVNAQFFARIWLEKCAKHLAHLRKESAA